jgi:hypothetical protein
MFYLGTPIYYFLLGRKMFGKNIKYPLWRMAHVPESLLRRRLYLHLDAPAKRFKIPKEVPCARGAAASTNLTQIMTDATD